MNRALPAAACLAVLLTAGCARPVALIVAVGPEQPVDVDRDGFFDGIRVPIELDVTEDGTYVIQVALPGMDPKDVVVSLMDNVLTVKGERKADHDTTGKDYFVREVAYGAFQRSFALPEGIDAAQVEAKYANGMLEVRVPAPRAATLRTIEVKAA